MEKNQCFMDMTHKIAKSLATLRKKEEEDNDTGIKEREPKITKRIIKEYDEQVYVYKYDNLDEMNQFLKGHQPPKLICEEIQSAGSCVNPRGDHFQPTSNHGATTSRP